MNDQAGFSALLEVYVRQFRTQVQSELSAAGIAYRTALATQSLDADIQALSNTTQQADQLLLSGENDERAMSRATMLQALAAANAGALHSSLTAVENADKAFVMGPKVALLDQSRLKSSAARLEATDVAFGNKIDGFARQLRDALQTFVTKAQRDAARGPKPQPDPTPEPKPEPLPEPKPEPKPEPTPDTNDDAVPFSPDPESDDDAIADEPSLEDADEEPTPAREDDAVDVDGDEDLPAAETTTPSDMFGDAQDPWSDRDWDDDDPDGAADTDLDREPDVDDWRSEESVASNESNEDGDALWMPDTPEDETQHDAPDPHETDGETVTTAEKD